jgi:hypothetical protein
MHVVQSNAKAVLDFLARSPGLTLLGMLSLAFAIGANTSVFNVVNAMTLTQHSTAEPYSVVTILTNRLETPAPGAGSSRQAECRVEPTLKSEGFESTADAPEDRAEGKPRSIQSPVTPNQDIDSGCSRSLRGPKDVATAGCSSYVHISPSY